MLVRKILYIHTMRRMMLVLNRIRTSRIPNERQFFKYKKEFLSQGGTIVALFLFQISHVI